MDLFLVFVGGVLFGAALGLWFAGLSEDFWNECDKHWRNK